MKAAVKAFIRKTVKQNGATSSYTEACVRLNFPSENAADYRKYISECFNAKYANVVATIRPSVRF